MNIQRSLLLKFIQDKDSEAIMNLDPKKFTGEHARILNFLRDFVADNSGKIPTRKIMTRHFPNFASDIVKKVKEPTRYLLDELDNAFTHNSLVDIVTEISKSLKNKGEVKPLEVLRKVEQDVLSLRTGVTAERQKAQDVTTRLETIRDRLNERRKKGGVLGFHFPFPSLTKQLRGARKKRLYTLIARTSVGKTVMSFLIALHIWKTYNVPVVFLSGELDYDQMEDMYLSFIGKIPVHKLENGDLTDKEMSALEETLRKINKTHKPFVFGFAGSFADVVTEVNTHRPEFLVVDSFYELDRFTEPDDTKRTAINSSRLQRMSREYDIPVLINSQANRATDKKKGADLSNISFSDTIGQTSDVVIGLNQTEEMRSAREMEIALLKNRGGRLAKLLINWNFEEHDFSEIRELDESGEARDTSELSHQDVEDEIEKEDKFAKLLGRDKKKKNGGKKKVIKKKDKALADLDVSKPNVGKKKTVKISSKRGQQKSAA